MTDKSIGGNNKSPLEYIKRYIDDNLKWCKERQSHRIEKRRVEEWLEHIKDKLDELELELKQ